MISHAFDASVLVAFSALLAGLEWKIIDGVWRTKAKQGMSTVGVRYRSPR